MLGTHTLGARITMLVVAVALTAMHTEPAGAGWSPPHRLAVASNAGGSAARVAFACDIVVRADGRVIATWITRTGESPARRSLTAPHIETAYVAVRVPNRGWSSSRTVWRHKVGLAGKGTSSGVYAGCPKIVAGAERTAELIWDRHRETPVDPDRGGRVRTGPYELMKKRLAASGRLGRATRWLSNAAQPVVLANDRGDAIVEVWRNANRPGSRYATIARTAGDRWGTLRERIDLGDSRVIDERGRAVVVSSVGNALRLRTWTAGAWSAARAVPRPTSGCRHYVAEPHQEEYRALAPAIGPDGTIALAGLCAGVSTDVEQTGFQLSLRKPDGTWVFPPTLDAGDLYQPEIPGRGIPELVIAPIAVGFDAGGDISVEWMRFLGVGSHASIAELRAAKYAMAAGTLGAPSSTGSARGIPLRGHRVATDGTTASAFIDTDERLSVITRTGAGSWASREFGSTWPRRTPGARPVVLHNDGRGAALLWSSASRPGVLVSVWRP